MAVAGEPLRYGSLATSTVPTGQDHELVRRLRAAGAIVIGKTRVPELCIWGWTDSAFGITRNPWDLDRTPGGSSGSGLAAVASAMVPLAHGSDGGGSIRIPAAACGLLGIKPGSGVIPGEPGHSGWCGLSSNGPLVTTVDDLALMLAVMADRPDLRKPARPSGALRIAVSVKPPIKSFDVDDAFAYAARETGALLANAGHTVDDADPPYQRRTLLALSVRRARASPKRRPGCARRIWNADPARSSPAVGSCTGSGSCARLVVSTGAPGSAASSSASTCS